MLQIAYVDENFNPVLPVGSKLWMDFIDVLVAKKRKRFTKYVPADFVGLNGDQTIKTKKKTISAFKKRISTIVQIRHDWIHNCGRPKSSIVDYTRRQAADCIRDIQTFVEEFDNHIETHRRA